MAVCQSVSPRRVLMSPLSRGRIDLERLGIFIRVFRSVTGAGVQDDEHLILLAGEDALLQACEEDGIVISIHVRIDLAQIDIREVFVDMDGRLAPVISTPRHIDARSEGIVWVV